MNTDTVRLTETTAAHSPHRIFRDAARCARCYAKPGPRGPGRSARAAAAPRQASAERPAIAAAAPGPGVHAATADIVVREAKTRRDRDAFVKFPWRIYAGDKIWSPPLLLEAKAFIDPAKHPFCKHGTAAQFLAFDQGQLVGRIQASDDPNYNQQHGTNVGCFGMFECIDDQLVASALLDAAADWIRRRGCTEIMGPIDYSTNYPSGLLIDGFDTPQRVMMNHNPPYYVRLLEGWRLTKVKDLYAWWFDDANDMLHKWAKRPSALPSAAE